MKEIYNVSYPGWEIVDRIGSGGFGTVYEIQRNLYGYIEKAALKVIRLPKDEGEVDTLRFSGMDDASITQSFRQQVADISREYRLMKQIYDNPNVVHCDDFRDIPHENGLAWDIYIKMELLNPLMKNLDKVATEPQIIQLGKDICNALIACQKKHIIHRDIKPQNVFISETGLFKLGDFGIARTIEHDGQVTAGIGTYAYMAPEVGKNQPYDQTADICSLGLMMYWLLNEGRGAFEPLPPAPLTPTNRETARLRRFAGETLPEPKHGSHALKAIVLKACAFNPADRYQSAQEMWDALRSLDNTVVSYHPDVIVNSKKDPVKTDVAPAPAFIPDPQPDEISEQTVGPDDSILKKGQKADVRPQQAEDVYDKTVGPHDDIPEKAQKATARVQDAEDVYDKTVSIYDDISQKGENTNTFTGQAEDDFDRTIGITFENQEQISTIKIPNQKNGSTKSGTEKADKVIPEETKPEKVKPEKAKPEKAKPEKAKKKNTTMYIILGAVAVVILLALLLVVSSCDTEPSKPDPKPPVETTVETTAEATEATDATEGTSTEPSDTAPALGDWSEWTDTLPADITAELYDIEEKTLYSSRNLETTSSSNKTMEGWELFDTVEAGFGPWSDWSSSSVKGTSTREVDTQTRYRYRTKETTTSSSSSLSGWTQYGSPSSSWGSWSSWSTSPVSQSSNRKVETRKEYRYRNTNSGGYSDWGPWSGWQDTPVSENDLRDVETRTVSTMSYFYYQCNDCGMRWYSTPCKGCGGSNTYYRTGSNSLIMDPVPFEGYYQSNDGSGMVFMNSPNGTSKTQYRYRTRTQLSGSTGSWSSWGTTPYTTTSTREVESRTVYRYCDKVTTYSYYRWGSWSSWSASSVSENSNRQVETKTFYRYRDKVSATTYYFRRWTEWSEFTDSEVTPSDTVEVKTQTQYRYKAKAAS